MKSRQTKLVEFARKPITRSMKHYCEVASQTDFLLELKMRNLEFKGPDLKLLPPGMPTLPKMTQGQFEDLGEVVIGAVQ